MPRIPPREGERLRRQERMGNRFREARMSLGYTLREAVTQFSRRYSKRSVTWLHNIENGANGMDAIDAADLAELYDYPVAFFIDRRYDVRKPNYPKTYEEWRLLCGGDADLAARHHAVAEAAIAGI